MPLKHASTWRCGLALIARHGIGWLVLAPGCAPTSPEGDADVASLLGRARSATGAPADLGVITHDLGPLMVSAGQELRHTFTLTNESGRTLRLLGAQATASCCSEVGVLPGSVPPGGSVEVPVEIRPGPWSGHKGLEFVVQTDDPGHPDRHFVLTATFLPDLEVRPLEGSGMWLPMGEAGRQRFAVTCRRRADASPEGDPARTATAAPPDDALGRPAPEALTASAPLTARFLSPTAETRRHDGAIESTRTFEVDIPAVAEAGVHRGEVVLRWADGRTWSQPITWQVAPDIQATPAGLLLRPGADRPTYAVALQADDQPFRVLDVSGPALAAPPEGLPTEALHDHRLHLALDPSRPDAAGASDLRIRTDHPDQPEVVLSVLVLPAAGEGD